MCEQNYGASVWHSWWGGGGNQLLWWKQGNIVENCADSSCVHGVGNESTTISFN